jgi:hypothetical protein
MFILILVIALLITWRFGDWRNWQKYQSTMLLFSLGNLLYNFVYHNHFLWKLKPDLLNHHIWEIIYTFTVFPLTALVFLSNYPVGFKKQLLHIFKYIFIYIAVEFLLLITVRIEYRYNWNLLWSLGWNCITFPVLATHYKKPLLAYSICLVIFFSMNWIFPFMLE